MKIKPVQSVAGRVFYLSLGFIFLVIGIIGLIMPIIPGFLFLIPAAYCFAKSSNFFLNMVKRNKRFGKYFS